MAHSGSGADTRPYAERGFHPGRVANAGRRLGGALLGAALPTAVVVAVVALASGSVDGSFVDWFGAAMETSLLGGRGLDWALHVSVLTGVAGTFVLGFALLVEGYFGLE